MTTKTTNANAAAKFFGLLRSGRGSLVNISDSNGIKDGHGWDAALHIHCKARWGLWATAPMTEFNMGTHGYGYYPKASEQSGLLSSGAPTGLHSRFDWGSSTPGDFGDSNPGRRYCWIDQGIAGSPQGVTRTDVFGIEMATTLGLPFDLTQALLFHLQIGKVHTGSTYTASGGVGVVNYRAGEYRPAIRQPETSGSQTSLVALQTAGTVASAGLEAWEDKAFTVPAGTVTNANVQFCPGSRSVFDLKSDLFIGYMAVEAATVTKGARVATLGQRGGGSLWDFGTALNAAHSDAKTGFFSLMHNQPNAAVSGSIPVCVRICFGTNDQNETELDLTAAGVASSTEEGYYQNLVYIYQKLATTWVEMGGTLSQLYLWVSQTPRLDSSYLAYQQAYARASALFAREYDNPSGIRVFATDFAGITNEAYLTANYYASGGTDKAHGTSDTAYSTVLGLEIDALIADGSSRRRMARRMLVG